MSIRVLAAVWAAGTASLPAVARGQVSEALSDPVRTSSAGHPATDAPEARDPRASSGPEQPVEEIVVEGSRARDSELIPRPDQRVELDTRPPRVETLADVVYELPGASLLRQGGLGASLILSIRGADFDQTVVLIDDIPVVGPDRGAFDFSLLPLDGLKQVELFRTSAPIRYGMGSIGGVVRLVPDDARAGRVKLRATAGSFDTYELRAEGGGAVGPVSVRAAASVLSAENDFRYLDDNATFDDLTDDRERTRQNAGVARTSAFARVGWQDGPHRLGLLGLFVHQKSGAPGPSTVISTESDRARTLVFSSLGYRYQGHAGETPLDVFATVATGWDRDRFRDLLGRLPPAREDTRDTFLSFDIRTGAFVGLFPGWTAGATLFYRRDDMRPNDEFATPGDTPSERDTVTAAVESLLLTTLADVELSVRASFSFQWTDARLTEARAGLDRALRETAPAYRFEGRIRPVHDLNVFARAASGIQLPTTIELFGNRDTIVGDLTLEPERSLVVDVGTSFEGKAGILSWFAEATAFWMRIEDIIVARRTAVGTVTFTNEREGTRRGLEAWLDLRLGSVLHATTALTLLRARFDNRGFDRDQPLRVPVRFFQRLEGAVQTDGGWMDEAAVFLEIDHRGGLFADLANLVRQPSLTLVNAGLRAHGWDRRLTAAFSVDNLFDTLGLDILRFPRPGRSFEVSLQWRTSL